MKHEIGHYVWYKLLTEKQKESYRKIYKRDNGKYFPYDYFRLSAEESFAEDYANFVDKKKMPIARKSYFRKLWKD